MPDVFGHGSNLKMVSAAGLAPAIPRFQAEHVAPTPRAGSPRWIFIDRGREKRDAETLGIGLAVRFKIGEPGGTCTLNPPADNGALC